MKSLGMKAAASTPATLIFCAGAVVLLFVCLDRSAELPFRGDDPFGPCARRFVSLPPGEWGRLVIGSGGISGRPVVIRGSREGRTVFSHIEVRADWVVLEDLVVDASSKGGVKLPSTAFWAVEDKVIDNKGRDDDAVKIRGSNVTYRRCEILNGRGDGVDIGGKCRNVLFEECRIHDFISDDDCHGVVIDSAVDAIFRKNEIWNCSGDCVQIFTGESEGTVIEENLLYVEADKAELCENAVDIKSTRGAVVRLNRMHGFRRPKRGSSDGTALVVHHDADNVVIEGNEIWDSSGGIRIGDTDKGRPDDCFIRRNVIRDLPKGARHGIQVSGTKNLMVFNNTFFNADPAITEFEKNPGLVIKNNLLIGSRMKGLSGEMQNNRQTSAQSAARLFFDLTTRDFRLKEGGDVVDAGVVVEGIEYEGTAPDLGAYELGWSRPVLVTTTEDLRTREARKPTEETPGALAAEIEALRKFREMKDMKRTEEKPTVDDARVQDLRKTLKKWVMEGVETGRKERIVIDVLGMRQRGTVGRADEDGVYIEFPGGGTELSWADLADERFYHVVSKYAADTAEAHGILAEFCEAAGLPDLAEIERDRAQACGK